VRSLSPGGKKPNPFSSLLAAGASTGRVFLAGLKRAPKHQTPLTPLGLGSVLGKARGEVAGEGHTVERFSRQFPGQDPVGLRTCQGGGRGLRGPGRSGFSRLPPGKDKKTRAPGVQNRFSGHQLPGLANPPHGGGPGFSEKSGAAPGERQPGPARNSAVKPFVGGGLWAGGGGTKKSRGPPKEEDSRPRLAFRGPMGGPGLCPGPALVGSRLGRDSVVFY